MRSGVLLGVLSPLILACNDLVTGYKDSDFKKCSQSGFCRHVNENGVALFKAVVKSSLYPEINFSLDVCVHEDGVVRVRLDEVNGLNGLNSRYDETASFKWEEGKIGAHATYGEKGEFRVVVQYDPMKERGLLHMEHFRIKDVEAASKEALVEGDAQAVQASPPNPRAWFEGDTEDAW
ncbi:hypothetical protein JOM56_012302 [Amanita muscaria]